MVLEFLGERIAFWFAEATSQSRAKPPATVTKKSPVSLKAARSTLFSDVMDLRGSPVISF
jgi:hypothetical protein